MIYVNCIVFRGVFDINLIGGSIVVVVEVMVNSWLFFCNGRDCVCSCKCYYNCNYFVWDWMYYLILLIVKV